MSTGGNWWAVQLPLAEATMLTSPAGPFFGRHGHRQPGEYRHEGSGRVLLDAVALGSLQAETDDFRVIEVDIGVYQMLIGRDQPYPVLPVDCDQRARSSR